MSIFNFGGLQSPPRRPLILPSATSPFCTSPSQLQEATLDQDVTFSTGIRSPGTRGRSVKEFEEQLANLKKENFNLKLRIYFLEERMGSNFNLDKEDVVKKNVELMVEVESLRKEVQEKHDLLCQAVKAMELEDEEHKKITTEKDNLVADYQQEIECLKTQILERQVDFRPDSPRSYYSATTEFNPVNQMIFQDLQVELQEKISNLEEELKQEKENASAIQLLVDQKELKIKTLEVSVEEVNFKLSVDKEKVQGLEKAMDDLKNKNLGLTRKLQERTRIIDDLTTENSEIQKKYSSVKAELDREHKRFEKFKFSSEQKIVELQTQLEASMCELKKSQELVVSSKSPSIKLTSKVTDSMPFSVQKPAAPARSPQKDTFALQSHIPSPSVDPTLMIPSTAFASPLPSPTSTTQNNSSIGGESIFDFDRLEKMISEGCDISELIEQLKQDRETFQQKIVKLKAEQLKACKIIKSMIDSRNKVNEETAQLKKKIQELEHELEDVVSKPSKAVQSSDDEKSMEGEGVKLVEHYMALTDELEEKTRILEATLSEKDLQMHRVQEQYEEILKNLKKKEDHIVDLQFELLSANQEKNNEKEPSKESELDLARLLEEREAEIERLNDNLTKRNCDLQGLVNNELWRKNREIEKLERRHASEILKLHNELASKSIQLKVIKEKISETGLEEIVEGGDGEQQQQQLLSSPSISSEHLKNELEQSEKLRTETNEVCTVLSKRLEELAIFLDSLLKQKSVLGFLGGKENKRLRQIIDQSLDLSRSFTMSMLINPDRSLVQLTNISGLLNDTSDGSSNLSLVPTGATLTYQSHLYKKDDSNGNISCEDAQENYSNIIDALRQQIVNLKYELQLRDVELNKLNNGEMPPLLVFNHESVLNTTSTTLRYNSDNQSESEAWSEPDRNVSRARIGLDMTETLNVVASKNFSSDSTEEIRKTPPKRGLSMLEKQIGELNLSLCEKESMLETEICANVKLREELDECEAKLKQVEADLVSSESKKVEIIVRMEAELEKVRNETKKEIAEKVQEVEAEKLAAITIAKEAEEVAEMAKEEVKNAEAKLKSMHKDMNEREINLRIEYENEFRANIKKITQETEEEIRTLRETIDQMRADYAANYVKKAEVVATLEDLERVRDVLRRSEERCEMLERENKEVLLKLKATQEKVNTLRSELDTATLQYSESVLEKTKIASDKANLEQELSLNALKEIELQKQFDEINVEMLNIKQTYQKQIGTLQQHKSRLEIRISELESANAELHNRLIKIGCGDAFLSTSLPNSPHINQMVAYRRQISDISPSDVEMETRRHFRLQPIDLERHEANSSPDLGIESDHGRFSSLETVQRPLLQTLELTESMSNLLNDENNQVCENDHCCRKTLEMAHENSDLKKKLIRTRRALEETVTQLTLANQRKKQVEKTICKQIHKTSQVLRKAKANLDSGSETEIHKKL